MVGIVTVPLVLSSLFLLANCDREKNADEGGEPMGGVFAPEFEECWAGQEEEGMTSFDHLAYPPVVEVSRRTADEPLVMLGYLEALLDGSVLCAVGEVRRLWDRVVK